MSEHVKCWEENMQGLKSWAWPPKLCRTSGVLQNLSSMSFFTMWNVLQNRPAEPQRFHRILGNFWEPGLVFWGPAFPSKCTGDRINARGAFPHHPQPEHYCLVAQCSATPATVAATPPCSATPFQTQISVRHLAGQGGGGKVRHQNF